MKHVHCFVFTSFFPAFVIPRFGTAPVEGYIRMRFVGSLPSQSASAFACPNAEFSCVFTGPQGTYHVLLCTADRLFMYAITLGLECNAPSRELTARATGSASPLSAGRHVASKVLEQGFLWHDVFMSQARSPHHNQSRKSLVLFRLVSMLVGLKFISVAFGQLRLQLRAFHPRNLLVQHPVCFKQAAVCLH